MNQAGYLSDKMTPVILCGGSGTRLWPLSRKSFPKQFVPLIGDKSLLTLTLERVGMLGPNLICVAAEDHRFLITDAMDDAGLQGRVILEPQARNTAAAIALAAIEVGDDGLLLVCPADHH
ncbi:MAG: sugar phosphate nucleotidyltransferase, partial [Lacisediminimonas sp.]|nr:sugar phosphate nucleotidyltransferase [Lacisediminimonas sp.]